MSGVNVSVNNCNFINITAGRNRNEGETRLEKKWESEKYEKLRQSAEKMKEALDSIE